MRPALARAPWVRTLLLVAAAAFVLDGAAWSYATSRLQSGVLASLDGLRQAGWKVQAGPPHWSGWPLAAALDMAVALDGAGAGVPVAWQADRLRTSLSPLHPNTLRFTPSGAQRIRLGAGPWQTLTAASLDVAADGAQVKVTGRNLTLSLPKAALEAAEVQAHAAGLGLQATLTGVQVTHAAGMPPPARIWLDAALTRPLPAGPDGAAQAAAQAAVWRDAGGVVTINSILAEAGDLAASGSGTARLDAALQPVAELTLQLRGWRPAVDALVHAGVVTPGSGVAAKAILGMLSGRDAADLATVPLRLGDGVVAVGEFPLARVPTLDWTPAHP